MIKKELEIYDIDDAYNFISRGVQGASVDPEPVRFPNIIYYEKLYEESKPTLEKLGIDLFTHTSRLISSEVAESVSILLAMDNKTKCALKELFPDITKKIYLLLKLIDSNNDIVDP